MQDLTPYQRIGGEPALKRLTHRFYEIMDELPETCGIRKIHPADPAESAQKLFEFLSGWMGGPSLFIEKYGPPMLRRRHVHLRIGHDERDQWLLCMKRALDEVLADDLSLRTELYEALVRVADHLRNQPEAGQAPRPCSP